MNYKLTYSTSILRSDGAYIPADPANSDYAAYLTWVSEGNVPLPYVAPAAEAPKVCSPAQGLVALYALKQITEADVNAAIAGIPDAVQRYTAQIAFARAIEWRRDSAVMQMLAAMLGLTAQGLDELFAFAVTVEV